MVLGGCRSFLLLVTTSETHRTPLEKLNWIAQNTDYD